MIINPGPRRVHAHHEHDAGDVRGGAGTGGGVGGGADGKGSGVIINPETRRTGRTQAGQPLYVPGPEDALPSIAQKVVDQISQSNVPKPENAPRSKREGKTPLHQSLEQIERRVS